MSNATLAFALTHFAAKQLWQRAMATEHNLRDGVAVTRMEAQMARRTALAWIILAIAVALYASGQAVWTSYDIRMPSAQVPFPGLYDIGFVGSYPFFLIGTLLLTRRNHAAVGRTRLIMDALSVIGASLALSWFFVLNPTIAGLAQAPSPRRDRCLLDVQPVGQSAAAIGVSAPVRWTLLVGRHG